MVEVKVCGITTVNDAARCLELGVDAIGLNFWSKSPRSTNRKTARDIVRAVDGQVQTVAVFVDASLAEVTEILEETGIEWAQLHGSESPQTVEALLPHAYKAIGVKDGSAVELARRYPGEHLLLDASVPGMPGGTGRTFDWTIAEAIARERTLTLAGGLTPANVAEAIRTVRPFRVDVASGVESSPGRKDAELVRAFVEAARSAS
jgi:phosphoribosylanthranilate isomerase